jgi:hypothetical protein
LQGSRERYERRNHQAGEQSVRDYHHITRGTSYLELKAVPSEGGGVGSGTEGFHPSVAEREKAEEGKPLDRKMIQISIQKSKPMSRRNKKIIGNTISCLCCCATLCRIMG